MLLDSWEGLNTKCLAMESPSEVTKRQEEHESLTPLGNGKKEGKMGDKGEKKGKKGKKRGKKKGRQWEEEEK